MLSESLKVRNIQEIAFIVGTDQGRQKTKLQSLKHFLSVIEGQA